MKQGFKFFLSVFLLCVCLPNTSLIAASSPEASLPESKLLSEKNMGTTHSLPTAFHIMQLLHLTPIEVGSGSSCSVYNPEITVSRCDDFKSAGDCSKDCSTLCSSIDTYCTDCPFSCPNCPSGHKTDCELGCPSKDACSTICGCIQAKCCSS
jgi:hypothetical protein